MSEEKERGGEGGEPNAQGVIHPPTEPTKPNRGGCKRRQGLRLAQAWLPPRLYAQALTLGNGNISSGIRDAIEASFTPRETFDATRWARALSSDYAPRIRNRTTFGEDLAWLANKTNLKGDDARAVILHLRSPPT